MLKIAYISPIYFSDVDISYLLELRKHAEVYYFIPLGPKTKGAAICIEKLLPQRGILPASIYPELQKKAELIDLDKTFIINRHTGKLPHIQLIHLYQELANKIDELGIDIVHTTEAYQYFEFPLYRHRKKTILSVHDPFLHSCVHSMRKEWQRKIAFRLLNHFILFNENQKDEFVQTYMTTEKNVYSSHLSAYSYLAHHNTTQRSVMSPYILFFGQITSHKGIDDLLPAMVALHETQPDIKLVLAGSGQYPIDITPYKSLEYIDIRNHFIPEEELAELIAHCEFVVCPYKDATQSGVVMSAYAFSKPVLATNVGGLPEMVIDGKLGCIVPPSSVKQLTDKMAYMIANKQTRSLMSTNIDNTYQHGPLSWHTITTDIVKNIYSNIHPK